MVTLDNEAATAAWRRADEERMFWQDHYRELLQQYPDQFVAVKDGKPIATGADLSEMLSELERLGLEPSEVWLRYLNAHPASTFFWFMVSLMRTQRSRHHGFT